MRYILDVRITFIIVLMSPVPAGKETNGRVSKGSGESLDVTGKGKFTRAVFNKMVMERQNKGRGKSPGMLLWMRSGIRRCPMWCCKYTHFHKRGTKIHTQLERRNLWHYVPFTENKAYGYLEHCAALLLMTGCQN